MCTGEGIGCCHSVCRVEQPSNVCVRAPFSFILNTSTFEDPRDADDALYHLDATNFYGKNLQIEFARGDRKSE